MSELVKNSLRAILFLLVQVYVLNKVPPLHRFITPYIYFLFILWLPFNTPRAGMLIIAFLYGLALDWFTQTPGLHAAACILIAYVRPFLISLLLPQEGAEISYVAPSPISMGWAPYSVFVLVLTIMHHVYLVFLEWLQFGDFWFFTGKILATTAISLLLILLTELLFNRKQRFRTNT
jgi:rod shape-determining protein MreD